MNREEVLKKLRENRKKIESFGVKRIGIFGSFARDEAREDSDIDILVEFEKGKATFRNVAELADFLERLFNRKVDLLTPMGIESIRIKDVKESIKRDIIYA